MNYSETEILIVEDNMDDAEHHARIKEEQYCQLYVWREKTEPRHWILFSVKESMQAGIFPKSLNLSCWTLKCLK